MKGKPLFILIALLAIFLTAAAAFAADEAAPSDEYEVSEPEYGIDYEIGDGAGNYKIAVNLYANPDYDGYKVSVYNPNSDTMPMETQFCTADSDSTVILSKLEINTHYSIVVSGYKEGNGTNIYSPETTKIEISRDLMKVPSDIDLLLTPSGEDTVIATLKNNHNNQQMEVFYSDSLAGDYQLGCSGIGECTINGLSLNTVYYFRYHWLGEAQCYHSDYTETIDVYSPLSEAALLILRAEQEEAAPLIGNKKIRVYFEDDESLTGHQIKAYDTGTGKLVKTVNVKRTTNPTYADITGLKNGTEYRFDICSYTLNGKKTEYGKISSVTATPQLKPVDGDIPSYGSKPGLYAYLYPDRKKIRVDWAVENLNLNTWSTGYYVELRRVDNGVLVMNGYGTPTTKTSKINSEYSPAYYTFKGVKIEYDVPYLVRLWKYNEKTPKGIGNTYSETYGMALSVPTAIKVASADSSVNVSWSYNGTADRIYVIYSLSEEGVKNSSYYKTGCDVSPDNNTCTITGLDNGTLYYFRMGAFSQFEGKSFSNSNNSVLTVMPLPVMNSATVTPGSKSLTVQYDKVDGVDGHIIQLYRMSGTKARLVKTVTSTDKNDRVTVSFKGLSNNTTYRVCISAYKKYEKKVYRSAVATYDDIIPSANAAAGKDLIGVSDLGESFDGFVDPLGELDSQTDTEY